MPTRTLTPQFDATFTAPVIYGQFSAIWVSDLYPSIYFIQIDDSSTRSVKAIEMQQPELNPFECSRESGVLDFWADPSEDVYTSEDGQPL
jgi:hypothetical protein